MVSLITVFRNEGFALANFLTELEKQEGHPDLAEVLLIDNGSGDVSGQIAQNWCAAAPNGRRYIRRDLNNMGAARAQGVTTACSEFVVFLDADCIPGPDWLAQLISGFQKAKSLDTQAAAFGAPAPPDRSRLLGQAWHLMTLTFWGHLGSTQAFRPSRPVQVAHVPTANIIYDRSRVLLAGNFSERYDDVCEDVDLNSRLIQQGHSIYFGPSPTVTHHWADHWQEWFLKIFKYGRGQMKVYRSSSRGVFPTWNRFRILPMGMILCFFVSLALSGTSAGWVLPTLYLGVVATVSIFSAVSQRHWFHAPLVGMAFFITHSAYAIGIVAGIWGRVRQIKKSLTPDVEPTWKKV